jgi:sugar phosphate isomerase/epimerase
MASENSEPMISRRRVLQLGAGAAMFAALGTLPSTALANPLAAAGRAGERANGRLVPPGKVGTILYTQRDAVSRRGIWNNPTPTMGFLGGPDYPDDPNDLGPLVPLPGGFLEVFEFLAAAGYKQIEFAGYGQNTNNQGGTTPNIGSGTSPNDANFPAYLDYARTLRTFLDATGLQAIGNHGFIPNTWPGPGSAGGAMHPGEYARFQLELEFASILGMAYMGTGNDPTSANNRNQESWDLAAEKWEALNDLGAAWGVRIYPHNHSPAYNFLQDGPMVEVTVNRTTGAPLATPQIVRGESGIRLMDHYLQATDPSTCFIELDVYWAHVAQHQHRWYYDWDGVRREAIFDVNGFAAANTKRIPLYHAKDGESTGQAPGVGNGYGIVPFGEGDIDFRRFFQEQGAKGFHHPNYEQDNAPGGSADQGRSLRVSRLSQRNMAALRG